MVVKAKYPSQFLVQDWYNIRRFDALTGEVRMVAGLTGPEAYCHGITTYCNTAGWQPPGGYTDTGTFGFFQDFEKAAQQRIKFGQNCHEKAWFCIPENHFFPSEISISTAKLPAVNLKRALIGFPRPFDQV